MNVHEVRRRTGLTYRQLDQIIYQLRLSPERVHIVGDCWEYHGDQVTGYGRVTRDGQRVLVHRAALQIALGRPLTQHALHLCDNPPCFRPDHLYEGTHQQNMADRDRRGRAAIGERNSRARLKDEDVQDIRRRYVRGENRWARGNAHQLAEQYGITKTHVLYIVSGKAWRHLPWPA